MCLGHLNNYLKRRYYGGIAHTESRIKGYIIYFNPKANRANVKG